MTRRAYRLARAPSDVDTEDEGAPEVPDLRGNDRPADPTPWRPNPFERDLMEDSE